MELNILLFTNPWQDMMFNKNYGMLITEISLNVVFSNTLFSEKGLSGYKKRQSTQR